MTVLFSPRPEGFLSFGLRLAVLLFVTSAVTPAGLHAQAVWSGAGGSNNWSESANWTGAVPASNGSAALQFGGATRLGPVNDLTGFTAAGITFNSGAGAFVLSGNALTLGGNLVNNSASLQTVQMDLILDAARIFNAGTGGLTVTGSISGAHGITKSGNGTLTLGGANAFTGVFNTGTTGLVVASHAQAFGSTDGGVIVQAGSALQLDGVTITGETLTLNGSGIADNSGALRVGNTSGEWAGPVILGGGTGGGTIGGARLGNMGTGNLTISGNITDNGGNFDLAIRSSNTATGKVILAGTNNTYRNTFLVVGQLGIGANNALPAAGALTLGNNSNQGSALFDLSGFNQEVGGLTTASVAPVPPGTGGMSQTITNSNASVHSVFTVRTNTTANLGTTTTNGALTGNLSLVKEGTGTLTLSGINNNSYTGTTSINAGSLVITKATGLGITGSGAAASGTIVAGGASLVLQNSITVGAEALTLSGSGVSNAGALRNQNGTNIWGGTITLAAAAEIQADTGSSLTIDVASGNAITGTFNLTLDAQGNITISDPVAINTGTLTKNGAGILTLNGGSANTYTGLTTVNAGTLVLGKTSGNAVGGGLTLTGNALLQLGQPNQIADTGLLTMGANNVFQLLGRSETLGGVSGSGTIENEGGGTSTLTLSTGATLTYSGILRDGNGVDDDGVLAIAKLGTGTQTLSGANTYTGETTVTAGILQLANDAALGGTVTGTTVATGATLDLNGGRTITAEAITINGQGVGSNGALRSSGSGTSTWAGPVTIGSGTGANGTRLGAINGSTLYVSGAVSDGGNGFDLAIRNDNNTASRVVLANAANSFVNTFVVVGTLAIDGGDNRLPVGTVMTLGNGSSVEFAAFDLNGFNQQVAGLAELGDMNKTITNTSSTPATFTVNNSGSYSFGTLAASAGKTGGILAGNLGLAKSGTGTLTLGKANTYTGPTRITQGTLALSGAGAFDSTTWLDIVGGTLSLAGRTGGAYAFTPSAGSVPISGSGAVTGNLTLGGTAVLRPGASGSLSDILTAGNGAGKLTFQNNLILQDGASSAAPRVVFSLHGATGYTSNPNTLPAAALLNDAFGNHDALDVNGILTLDAGSSMRVVLGDGYVPTGGEVFNLLDWNSLVVNANGSGGQFTLADLDLSQAILGSGLFWNMDYFLSHGIIIVAPEPSRALFLGLAALALTFRRRRVCQIP